VLLQRGDANIYMDADVLLQCSDSPANVTVRAF
jgi:hypothetical protein